MGSGLRRDAKEALGRGLVRSGDLDGAIVMVESHEEAERALVRVPRPRCATPATCGSLPASGDTSAT